MTIIVLLVLSGTVISMLTGEDGILIQAQETKFKSELSSLKDEYMLFINNKKLESPTQFEEESIWASKNSLTYNTKIEENGNIEDVLPSISKSLKEKIEIVKGKLLIKTQNEREVEWAEEIGVEVNPYEITEDGVLVSSNGNLLLIDEEGTLELPETIKEIGEGAFSSAEGLKTIIIPGSIKNISKNAFANNTTLEKVIIKEGVETIGEKAFFGCKKLKDINFAESVTAIGIEALRECENLDNVVLPSNLKVLEMRLFRNCYNLKNISLPSNLEEISEYTFWNCSKIEEISISSTVKKINAKSFSGCKKLTKINIDSNNTEFTYNNGMLIRTDGTEIAFVADTVLSNLTEFEIPNGIINFNTDISSYNNIKKIILPSSLTLIGSVAMFPRSVENIEVKEGNTSYCVEGNCLYSIDKKTIVASYSKEEEITVIDNVETIGDYSFKFETNAKNIIIPDYVKTIKPYAFSSLTNLESLKIGAGVTHIEPLFRGTVNYGEITIDENNESYMIENNILYSKDKKKLIKIMYSISGNFVLDSNVEEIGSYAFYLQSNMTKATLNEGIKNIKISAFSSCSNLTSIEIASTIESIGNTAFDVCNKLSEIIINKPEGSISGAPWGCPVGMRAVKWNG